MGIPQIICLTPMPAESEFLGLEDLEQEKLDQLVGIIKACRYTILNKSEWEAANSEDFLVRQVENDKCTGRAWGARLFSVCLPLDRCIAAHRMAPLPHPTSHPRS